MSKRDLAEYKKKYDNARHHAWAGSVLLAVLIATRGFLELTSYDVDDRIFLVLGFILIFYTLISVFFTYTYRPGLSAEQKQVVQLKVKDKDPKIEKEKLKLEKKKAKAEAKKAKKAK